VSDLVSPNTQRDFQHFQTTDFLAKCRIETRATLFDISEVERCSVGDDLNVVGIPEIGIGPRDGGAVGDSNGLRKRGPKVRVCRAAIADEPAGVHVEVHEVGEAHTLRPRYRRCLAARQGSELIEVDWIRSLGFQVCVEEGGVANFIEGVAGDVRVPSAQSPPGCAQIATVLAMVQAGLGISLIPEMARNQGPDGSIVYRSLDGTRPRRTLALAMSRQRKSSRCVIELAKFIRDHRQKRAVLKAKKAS